MSPPTGSGAQPRRILVIANETCAGRGVVDEVRYRAGAAEGAEVVVVAPALAKSRLEHWLSSDSERRRSEATARLEESIKAFEAAGMNARGALGDADPLQALDDALRVFEPDEIVISTHPPARSNWLERQVVRKARERYKQPITHVVVDLEHERTSANEYRRPMVSPERRTRVFAAAAYDEALAIQSSGFRDRPVPGDGGSGVWVSERPPAGEGGDSWVVFAIDVPEDAASAYARGDGPEGRQYLMPAELLNRSGPPVAQDQWSE
jgi:hypothetical protein